MPARTAGREGTKAGPVETAFEFKSYEEAQNSKSSGTLAGKGHEAVEHQYVYLQRYCHAGRASTIQSVVVSQTEHLGTGRKIRTGLYAFRSTQKVLRNSTHRFAGAHPQNPTEHPGQQLVTDLLPLPHLCQMFCGHFSWSMAGVEPLLPTSSWDKGSTHDSEWRLGACGESFTGVLTNSLAQMRLNPKPPNTYKPLTLNPKP